MVYIRVLVDSINKETMQKILDYYNSKKEDSENPLERLPRAEGGFQINLPESQWEKDYRGFIGENQKIQQVRWKNGRLVGSHISLNMKQYMMLYDAMVFSLEPGTVILEE